MDRIITIAESIPIAKTRICENILERNWSAHRKCRKETYWNPIARPHAAISIIIATILRDITVKEKISQKTYKIWSYM